jgi:hypothetical protein
MLRLGRSFGLACFLPYLLGWSALILEILWLVRARCSCALCAGFPAFRPILSPRKLPLYFLMPVYVYSISCYCFDVLDSHLMTYARAI